MWLVLAAFAAVFVLWGSTYLGIRIAIDTIPPLLMGGGVLLAGALIVAAIGLIVIQSGVKSAR